jgi:uncharacterized membrane protein YfbV (UPF0208 family)
LVHQILLEKSYIAQASLLLKLVLQLVGIPLTLMEQITTVLEPQAVPMYYNLKNKVQTVTS